MAEELVVVRVVGLLLFVVEVEFVLVAVRVVSVTLSNQSYVHLRLDLTPQSSADFSLKLTTPDFHHAGNHHHYHHQCLQQ